MKLISFFLIITLANLGFGQNLVDTTVIVDNDTFSVYRKTCSRQAIFKSELSHVEYISKNLPDSVRIYIADRGISGRIFFKLLIDVHGETHIMGVFKSTDPYLEEEFYKIFKNMTWEPALDSDGNAVNTMVFIPIVFHSNDGGKQKKKRRN